MSGFYPKKNRGSLLSSNRSAHNSALGENESNSCLTGTASGSLLDSIVITVDDYIYPREDSVPAGFYFSKIARVDAREKKTPSGEKKVLVDVYYDLEGYDCQNKGQTFKIKQSYPINTAYIRTFFDAMVKAGAKSNAGVKNVVGVQERIKLAYWSETSDIGSIVAREPYEPPEDDDEDAATDSDTNNDDEFDDFLEDDPD